MWTSACMCTGVGEARCTAARVLSCFGGIHHLQWVLSPILGGGDKRSRDDLFCGYDARRVPMFVRGCRNRMKAKLNQRRRSSAASEQRARARVPPRGCGRGSGEESRGKSEEREREKERVRWNEMGIDVRCRLNSRGIRMYSTTTLYSGTEPNRHSATHTDDRSDSGRHPRVGMCVTPLQVMYRVKVATVAVPVVECRAEECCTMYALPVLRGV